MQPAGAEGLRFIERCANGSTQASVEDFLATIRQMGCTAAACGAWVGIGRQRRNRFFFVDWPADWVELYNKNGWFAVDPVAMEARRRIAPFLFSELAAGKLNGAQREFIAAAQAYGWREVFAVPIHGPGSLQGLVTMAIREQHTPGPGEQAILEAMARTIWERCRRSEGFGIFEQSPPKLSAREIECPQWAAVGKSDSDIGVLLGISAATAHFHIERAKRRLGVKTRVEAAAVGVLHGVI